MLRFRQMVADPQLITDNLPTLREVMDNIEDRVVPFEKVCPNLKQVLKSKKPEKGKILDYNNIIYKFVKKFYQKFFIL